MIQNNSSEELNSALEKSVNTIYLKHIKDSSDWLKINEKLQLFSSNIEEFLDVFENLHNKIKQVRTDNTYLDYHLHSNGFSMVWGNLEGMLTKKFGVAVENKKLFSIIKLQILNSGLKRKSLSELFMVSFLHTPGYQAIFREAVENACATSSNMETIVFTQVKEILNNLNLATQYLSSNSNDVKYLQNYGAAFPSTVSATLQLILNIILNSGDTNKQKKKQTALSNGFGTNKQKELVEFFIKSHFFSSKEVEMIIRNSFAQNKLPAQSHDIMLGAALASIEKNEAGKKQLVDYICSWGAKRMEASANTIIARHFSNEIKARGITFDIKECATITKLCHYFATNLEAAKLIYTSVEPQSAMLLSQILTSGFMPDNREVEPSLTASLLSIHEKYCIEKEIKKNTSVKTSGLKTAKPLKV